MPTTSLGLAGFNDLIFPSVFISLPPITRSYSRPSSERTLAMASRIARVFSPLVKSRKGSFLNGPRARIVVAAGDSAKVAMMSSRGMDDGSLGKGADLIVTRRFGRRQ